MTDQPSLARLALVHPTLRAKVLAAAAKLATQGVFFRVAEGLRTVQEQNALYALGRTVLTKPDGSKQPIVTKARGGYSNHNMGCAVDCFPFVYGDSGPLDLTDPEAPEFRAMIAALKAEGLAWGGDWVSICDKPHFQLANVPVTPTSEDRALYANGGLEAVWKQYA